MIGVTEILTIVGVILLIAIFGRKTLQKLLRDVFSVKKDYEEIKKEFDTEEKKE